MLILSRKQGEELMIGDDITIRVVSNAGGQVRIGITAPKEIEVHRKEIYEKINGGSECEPGLKN